MLLFFPRVRLLYFKGEIGKAGKKGVFVRACVFYQKKKYEYYLGKSKTGKIGKIGVLSYWRGLLFVLWICWGRLLKVESILYVKNICQVRKKRKHPAGGGGNMVRMCVGLI